SAVPIPIENPVAVPNMVDVAPYGNQFSQAPATYYGPADNYGDPYASAYGDSSAGAAPPVDSFGPQDMGPAQSMDSATTEDAYGDPYGGGQSFT
ncbi:hypothetical protein LRR18_18715, partial [Mangrovimonas sp. AS39]|uniref:hypothetical protein n=1 Tax=Mangrovimonas futianensis TaxID=2895523 RepID=UPI001E364DD8